MACLAWPGFMSADTADSHVAARGNEAPLEEGALLLSCNAVGGVVLSVA